ncbi:hypothetical protein [Cryptosporangium japonicum]|uniref:Uncharacterized protein n=1 Tax=Cryptosporangium japonicum TaxID=80872 RepID=A0ABP3E5H9_9ACTN
MNETEQAVRTALTDWAAEVSARPGLAGAVLARNTRARRRRRALLSCVAAVVVLAGAGALWVVAPWRTPDRLVPAAPPRPADSAPPSPVDFGWLPDGFDTEQLDLVPPGVWRLTATSGREPIEVTISDQELTPTRGTGRTGTVDVNGVTATTYSVPPHEVGAPPYGTNPPDADGATEEITWQRKPGQWVRVHLHFAGGKKPLAATGEELLRVARGLRDTERRVPALVSIADPTGLHVVASQYDEWRGATINLMRGSGKVWITADSGEKDLTPWMIRLGNADTITGYAGFRDVEPVLETRELPGRTVLRKRSYQALWKTALVRFPENQVAVVLVPKNTSDADLMTLASGVTPGPDYIPVRR